jgi:hypothetical protein
MRRTDGCRNSEVSSDCDRYLIGLAATADGRVAVLIAATRAGAARIRTWTVLTTLSEVR